MERKREAKRSMATVTEFGLSRRRYRVTALRDSPDDDEEEEMRLQETARLRERQRVYNDRDRDRESMGRTKRRRLVSSAEESFKESDGQDDGPPPPISRSNQASRRTVTPDRSLRSLKVSPTTDDIIGVPVPRRARSASLNRSYECWNSRTGEFGGDQSSRRRLLPPPLTRRIDGVSILGPVVHMRKNMKPLGAKIQTPTRASRKPLQSVEEDIEIEVAEALFDLMTQSQSLSQKQTFKKDNGGNHSNSNRPDLSSSRDVGHKSKRSSIHPSQIAPETTHSPSNMNDHPTSFLGVGLKRKVTDYLKEEEANTGLVQEKSQIGISLSNEELIISESKISSLRSEKMPSGNTAPDAEGRHQVISEVMVVPKFYLPSSPKSNADDSLNSTLSKRTVEVTETKKEAKFKIDMMALPPIPILPERDGLTHLVPDHKFLVNDFQMKSSSEAANEDSVSAEKVIIQSKQELSKLGLDVRRHQDNTGSNGGTVTKQSCQNKSSWCSLPTPTMQGIATSWPGDFLHSGYMQPPQIVMALDGSARSSTQLQLPPFSFSQPRLNTSVTHQYIARSICYHQKLMKTCPAGPATIYGAEQYDCCPNISTSNLHHGKSLQEDLLGRQALTGISDFSAEGKNFELANSKDAAKSRQLLPQQASLQGPVDNLQGSAMIFPLGQHLVGNLPVTLSGTTKCVTTVEGKKYLSNDSCVPPVSSTSFLAAATAMSINCSNFPANAVPPFVSVVPKNGCPYSISENSRFPVQYEGAQGPVFPLFSASVFHDPQNQPRYTFQPLPNVLHPVQQASKNAGTSSSNKASQIQHEIGTSISGYSFLDGMQLQQSQKQFHLSSKLDKEMGRQVIAVVNSQGCHSTSNYQNVAVPVQSINSAIMPYGALGKGGNYHGSQQQQESKFGVEAHKTIGHPFRALSTAPSLNFPPASPRAAFPQILSDVMKQGLHFVPALATQDKNFQVADLKMIANSNSNNDGKSTILWKSIGQSPS